MLDWLPSKIFGVRVSSRRRKAAEARAPHHAVSEPVVANATCLTVNGFVGRTKRSASPMGLTEPEFIAYARYLGMDPVLDSDLLWVAEEALRAPLPEDCTEHYDNLGRIFYYSLTTRASSWTHPLEKIDRDLYADISKFRQQSCSQEERAAVIESWRRRCERAEMASRDAAIWTQHTDEEGKTFYYSSRERRSSWSDPRVVCCYILRLQLKALSVVCEHCGVEVPTLQSSGSETEHDWPELDAASTVLLEEAVPDERDEQLMPYTSSWAKVQRLMGGCYKTKSNSQAVEVSKAEVAMPVAGECVVCLDADATHILVPCGHQALCVRCKDRYFSPSPHSSGRFRCPCCRTHIEQVIEVFVPKPRYMATTTEPSMLQSL